MVDFTEILTTDHRGYITDIAIEDYFQIRSFKVDKINNTRINSRKLSHHTKFVTNVEELIEETCLLEIVNENYHKYAIVEMLEMIDQKISHVLDKACKASWFE